MTTLNRCPLCGGAEGYSHSEDSTHRWRFLACQACGETITEVRAVSPGLTGPSPRYNEAWNCAGQYAQALRNGNFALLEALMDMCSQYLTRPDGEHLWHDHMSAGEGAMDVLAQAGMLRIIDGRHFLDWDALERRRADI